MATCRTCGVQIQWFHRPDGSTHPPLNPIGDVLVVRDGVVHTETAYVRHRCRDADAAAHAKREAESAGKRREQREQARLEQRDHKAYDRALREAWVEALPRDCPKCGEPADEPCINLVEWSKHNRRKETVWPHPERRIETSKNP